MISSTCISIPADETPFCGTHHNRDDVAGYIVVHTRIGVGRIKDIGVFLLDEHEAVHPDLGRFFGAGSGSAGVYSAALDMAKARRAVAPRNEWACIDVLYVDGCRGIL